MSTLRAYLGESTQYTVYEVELIGIFLAAHLLRWEGCSQGVEIGIDNQADMNTLNLNKPVPGHYIVDEAQKLLKKVKLEYPASNLLVGGYQDTWGLKGMNWQMLKSSKLQQVMPAHLIPSQHSYAAHSPSVHWRPGIPIMRCLSAQRRTFLN